MKCEKFLAAGTVAEYSLHAGTINNETLQKLNDMYGATKKSVRHFLEVRARQLGQPLIWMVLPSTYVEKRTDSNIITYTICTLLEGNIPQYGDLSQMWDFLYISDVVSAIRMIGECGIPGKSYRIGSGQYWPVSFEPQISFRQGIWRTIKWTKENMPLSKYTGGGMAEKNR